MRIFRTAFVLAVALVAVATLAGVASAGGRTDPPPEWLGAVMAAWLLFAALFISVVSVGVYRRRRL